MANPQWPGAGQPAGPPANPYQAQGGQGYAQPPQQAAVFAGHPTSGLQLTTGFIPLQWMLYFKRPILEINGQARELSWGTETIPLPPGQYSMSVYVRGLFGRQFDTRMTLTIYPNHVTGMSYTTAIFIFMSGTLRELGYKPWGS